MPHNKTVIALPAATVSALFTLALPSEPAHALTPPQDPSLAAASLAFAPGAPAPGSTVTVTYHPLAACCLQSSRGTSTP